MPMGHCNWPVERSGGKTTLYAPPLDLADGRGSPDILSVFTKLDPVAGQGMNFEILGSQGPGHRFRLRGFCPVKGIGGQFRYFLELKAFKNLIV